MAQTGISHDRFQNDQRVTFKTHVTDGLPYPLQIARKLEAYFSESLHTYKDKMSIENFFSHAEFRITT